MSKKTRQIIILVATNTQRDLIQGGGVTNNHRETVIKGDAFFDSAKQINQYQGIRQRHLDSDLMATIIDSIPEKKTRIEIFCGGEVEGMNLGKEMRDYLVARGFSKPSLEYWYLTGNFDLIEYSFDRDSVFRISIHPQSNVASRQ